MPSFKDFNNSQEFLIIDFVAGLSGDHFSRAKSYRVLLTNIKLLVWLIVRFVDHLTR